jgi:hypothetical protein
MTSFPLGRENGICQANRNWLKQSRKGKEMLTEFGEVPNLGERGWAG